MLLQNRLSRSQLPSVQSRAAFLMQAWVTFSRAQLFQFQPSWGSGASALTHACCNTPAGLTLHSLSIQAASALSASSLDWPSKCALLNSKCALLNVPTQRMTCPGRAHSHACFLSGSRGAIEGLDVVQGPLLNHDAVSLEHVKHLHIKRMTEGDIGV